MRGITSRVDIVWINNGLKLKRIEGANVTSISKNLTIYTTFYSILQLSTSDDGRVFHCEGFVNVTPLVMATGSLTLNVTGKFLVLFYYSNIDFIINLTVAKPAITILPIGPIQGAVVGNPQNFHCVVSTVSGVELSSVTISWMGPREEHFANNSRVLISQIVSSGNHFVSDMRLAYLMEGDEGIYTCTVMILKTKTINSDAVLLNTLTSLLITLSVEYFIHYYMYHFYVISYLLNFRFYSKATYIAS